jgi:hypothetical protein
LSHITTMTMLDPANYDDGDDDDDDEMMTNDAI